MGVEFGGEFMGLNKEGSCSEYWSIKIGISGWRSVLLGDGVTVDCGVNCGVSVKMVLFWR